MTGDTAAVTEHGERSPPSCSAATSPACSSIRRNRATSACASFAISWQLVGSRALSCCPSASSPASTSANGQVVKGVNFEGLRSAGDPAELARRYNAEGIDELVILDITATLEARRALADTIRAVARELFIPLAVGGGIRTEADAAAAVEAGADKVSLNTAALADPGADHRARRPLRQPGGRRRDRREARSAGDTLRGLRAQRQTDAGRDAVEWAREAEARGAGEILLTSIDRDGTKAGFDCALTAAVSSAVSIPVIASGGAGGLDAFRRRVHRPAAPTPRSPRRSFTTPKPACAR